jgi:hypothetical protein
MKLKGSCHCKAVHFEVESYTPYPYNRCYCSICRKTAGGGGYSITIMGEAATMKVEGAEHVSIYNARMEGDEPGSVVVSPVCRHFCKHCASFLWVSDPSWPQWVYPFASCIDTPLPKPPERTHLMLDFAAKWFEIPHGDRDKNFPRYPDESIENWHKRLGLYKA